MRQRSKKREGSRLAHRLGSCHRVLLKMTPRIHRDKRVAGAGWRRDRIRASSKTERYHFVVLILQLRSTWIHGATALMNNIKIDHGFVKKKNIPNPNLSVPVLPLHYIISRSPFSEQFVQVIYKFLRPFVRGEMSTFLMLRIKYFVA